MTDLRTAGLLLRYGSRGESRWFTVLIIALILVGGWWISRSVFISLPLIASLVVLSAIRELAGVCAIAPGFMRSTRRVHYAVMALVTAPVIAFGCLHEVGLGAMITSGIAWLCTLWPGHCLRAMQWMTNILNTCWNAVPRLLAWQALVEMGARRLSRARHHGGWQSYHQCFQALSLPVITLAAIGCGVVVMLPAGERHLMASGMAGGGMTVIVYAFTMTSLHELRSLLAVLPGGARPLLARRLLIAMHVQSLAALVMGWIVVSVVAHLGDGFPRTHVVNLLFGALVVLLWLTLLECTGWWHWALRPWARVAWVVSCSAAGWVVVLQVSPSWFSVVALALGTLIANLLLYRGIRDWTIELRRVTAMRDLRQLSESLR